MELQLIEKAKENKDFVQDVDGFVYWTPTPDSLLYASYHLRALADELDKQNEEWNKIIEKELGRS